MAVCGYCQSTLLKDADSISNIGITGEVLEDYSPLQHGTTGQFGGNSFTVIGRIQLRYDAGFWNEWYILFDSGDTAWLSDASGQYTITRPIQTDTTLPIFESLQPGKQVFLVDGGYTVADIRTAQCTGGQGELPFAVGKGWLAKVADLRLEQRFSTLDYSFEKTILYQGNAIELSDLKCQLLRDEVEIQRTAGRFKGKIDNLACPACGGNIKFSPGLTTHVICPACSTPLDTSGKTAAVISAAQTATLKLSSIKTPITLGDKATIDGQRYDLLGILRRQESGESNIWTEYLLYSAQQGFLWLVQTDEGWYHTEVLNTWPQWHEGNTAKLGEQTFSKAWDYSARVIFAAGAFNWRVAVGETTRVLEFNLGEQSLAAEINPHELTWSHSRKVSAQIVLGWFGKQNESLAGSALMSQPTRYITVANWATGLLLLINLIPMALSFDYVSEVLLIAWLMMYLPALAMDRVFKPAESKPPNKKM